MPDNSFRQQTYNIAMGGFQADLLAAQAEFQKAEIAGDAQTAAAWLTEMANIRARANETHRIASEEVAAQAAAPKVNPFGLTDEEMEAAKLCDVDPKIYAEGIVERERRKKLGMYPDKK